HARRQLARRAPPHGQARRRLRRPVSAREVLRGLRPRASPIGAFGPAHLHRALYLPAIVAMRANPNLRPFAERLRARGKPAKVVPVAVMRKLLRLAWTLLRTGRSFASTAPSRPPERPGDAEEEYSPVLCPALTRPTGRPTAC